jgi:hypothetical protein
MDVYLNAPPTPYSFVVSRLGAGLTLRFVSLPLVTCGHSLDIPVILLMS